MARWKPEHAPVVSRPPREVLDVMQRAAFSGPGMTYDDGRPLVPELAELLELYAAHIGYFRQEYNRSFGASRVVVPGAPRAPYLTAWPVATLDPDPGWRASASAVLEAHRERRRRIADSLDDADALGAYLAQQYRAGHG